MPFFETDLSTKIPSKLIENPQTLGEHLRNRRFAVKLLQKEVAAIIGVTEDSITLWENGRTKPLIHHYPKIILFLGYNPFPVDASTLGGRMKKYRIENGLSQEELGKLVGVNESSIFSWEKNEHKPFPGKLRLLEGIIDKIPFNNKREPSQ